MRCFIRDCQHHFIYPSRTYHDLCRIYDRFFCFDAGYQYDRNLESISERQKTEQKVMTV